MIFLYQTYVVASLQYTYMNVFGECKSFLCPQTEGRGGHIVLGVDPVGISIRIGSLSSEPVDRF